MKKRARSSERSCMRYAWKKKLRGRLVILWRSIDHDRYQSSKMATWRSYSWSPLPELYFFCLILLKLQSWYIIVFCCRNLSFPIHTRMQTSILLRLFVTFAFTINFSSDIGFFIHKSVVQNVESVARVDC